MEENYPDWIEWLLNEDGPKEMALNSGFRQRPDPAGCGGGEDIRAACASEPADQGLQNEDLEDDLKTNSSRQQARLDDMQVCAGQRFRFEWNDDWKKNSDVLKTDFTARIPRERQLQASLLNLIQEREGAPSFFSREWVTGWKTCDKAFEERNIWLRDTTVVLTAAEATFLLKKKENWTASLLTLIRRAMRSECQTGQLILDKYAKYNPWYRYVYLQGTGQAVQRSLAYIYWVLEEFLYKFMTPQERRDSTPPLPPLHPAGIRPMVLTLNCDQSMSAIALNPGFCSIYFKDTHVAGRGSCSNKKKIQKQR